MSRMRVKPSRSQSILGMIVGSLFIVIGLTNVVRFGLFGVIWTLMAVLITVFHGINVFSKKGISTMTIDDGSDDVEDKLLKLEKLRSKNLVTMEEYERKREEIIKEF